MAFKKKNVSEDAVDEIDENEAPQEYSIAEPEDEGGFSDNYEYTCFTDLSETCNLMTSDDYQDRFVAEYVQLKIRHDKLYDMIVKMEAGTLNFEPDCPEHLFAQQLEAMESYMLVLRVRAEIEGISLDWNSLKKI